MSTGSSHSTVLLKLHYFLIHDIMVSESIYLGDTGLDGSYYHRTDNDSVCCKSLRGRMATNDIETYLTIECFLQRISWYCGTQDALEEILASAYLKNQLIQNLF